MVNSLKEPIDDLRSYLVRLLTPSGGEVNGTGFLCHPDGYVLTCRHVIEDHLRHGSTIVSLLYGEESQQALICEQFGCAEADIAVLKLTQNSDQRRCLRLDTHWRVKLKDDLESFGYPAGVFTGGVAIRGQVGGLTPTPIDNVEVLPIVGLNMGNVDGGYSGAPVLSNATQRVIGLLYAKHTGTQAFFTPIDKLFPHWRELEAFHDVYQQLRRRLEQEAKQKLCKALRNTPFIPLNLEQGVLPLPDRAEQRRASETEEIETQREAHGRRWEALSPDELLPPQGYSLLSSDVGTGKTTFVYWLATELLSKTAEVVPVIMSCAELERSAAAYWPELKKRLIESYSQQFLEEDLDDFLEWARKGHLAFLFDGLDQIKSGDYSTLARTAYAIAGGNTALITSRPSAVLALERDPSIRFLRLKPFSEEDQQHYFGAAYPEAKKLGEFAPELAQVPMLANMIRTLIEEGQAGQLKRRTEVYEKFVDYILASHETNEPFYREHRPRSRQIDHGLCALAYKALAEPEPQIQRIEEDLVFESLPDEALAEELPRFGLVNRVLDRGEEFFWFTHQSFQEFFAARYADSHEEARTRILSERWNPKWEQVIQFLAGLRGDQILKELLTGQDNVIHAGLFLATRCAPEAKTLSRDSLKRIEQGLDSVLEEKLFRQDVLEAAEALVRVGGTLDTALVGALIGRLADEANQVANDWNRTAEERVRRSGEGLGERLTPEQGEAVAARLGDEDRHMRRLAVWVLKGLGERLTPAQAEAVAARLGDKDWRVRQAAVEALGGLGGRLTPAQAEAVAARLGDADRQVRKAAVEALKGLGGRLTPAQVDAVAARLGDEHWDVRKAAAGALKGWGERLTPAQVEAVAARLGDEDKYAREAAVQALGGLGGRLTPAQDAVLARLGDEDWWVREAAMEALRGLGERLTPAQVEAIVARLGDANQDVRVRWAAARALKGLGERLTPAQAEAVAARLGDEDRDVREAAVEALGGLGERLTAAQVDAVLARLGDGESGVRRAAVEALGGLGERLTPAQVEAVAAWLGDEDSGVRRAAVEALGGLGERLTPAQVEAVLARLGDEDWWVREAAVQALKKLYHVGVRLPALERFEEPPAGQGSI